MKEAAEIKKIPCAVCRDLMPLVQDGVASPESEALVKAHLAACPACRALRQGADAPCRNCPPRMTVRSCKNCAADTAPICCCWPLWALRRAWPWGIQAAPTGSSCSCRVSGPF
ncbi:MAG: hypothetical protein EP147_19310 [Subdoligranulum sp.]|nr:hypothetical protein [Subdoligranulum sp.]